MGLQCPAGHKGLKKFYFLMAREMHDIKRYFSTKMNSCETENPFTDCFFLLVISPVENQQVKIKIKELPCTNHILSRKKQFFAFSKLSTNDFFKATPVIDKGHNHNSSRMCQTFKKQVLCHRFLLLHTYYQNTFPPKKLSLITHLKM